MQTYLFPVLLLQFTLSRSRWPITYSNECFFPVCRQHFSLLKQINSINKSNDANLSSTWNNNKKVHWQRWIVWSHPKFCCHTFKSTFNLFKSCLIVIIIYCTTLRGHFKPHSKQILKTKSHAFAILIAVHACT